MFFTDADVGREIVVEDSNEQSIGVEVANQYPEIHRATTFLTLALDFGPGYGSAAEDCKLNKTS